MWKADSESHFKDKTVKLFSCMNERSSQTSAGIHVDSGESGWLDSFPSRKPQNIVMSLLL